MLLDVFGVMEAVVEATLYAKALEEWRLLPLKLYDSVYLKICSFAAVYKTKVRKTAIYLMVGRWNGERFGVERLEPSLSSSTYLDM